MRYIGKNPYSSYAGENLILRDNLAIDRTVLANERTFLAYVRTALTLLIGGVGVRNLFVEDASMEVLGIVFIILSVFVLIVGSYKFMVKKIHIDKLTK